MKNYKDYPIINLGSSDIASLVLRGCGEIEVTEMSFGSDGRYQGYLVDENAQIGEHYRQVASFETWLKIYDDRSLTFEAKGKLINIFRAGMMGCIIQVIK